MNQKKQLQQDKALDRHVRGVEKELIANYQRSLKEIRGKLAELYEKTDGDFNAANKYNRLAALEASISKEISELTKKNAKTLQNGIAGHYEESFLRTAFLLENEVKASLGYALMNKKAILQAIENPLDRVGFINRHKEGQLVLARQLREEITQGLIQGKSYGQTAKKVKERFGVGAFKATRIVQTETNRVRNRAKIDSMQEASDAGVNIKKRWMATLDKKTRDSHGDLDGVTIDLDENFEIDGDSGDAPGNFSSPENTINCRCTMVSIVEGFEPNRRRVKGEGVTEYKTYSEWKNNVSK
ncbi:phage minor head protein [Rossellomorea aquimaris]|uniref:phage head morphogenesis protein n=1 Tax=Rossellomorea aquimaris TaxID=189382 RepID=UPI0016534413|nr:phage minor head protein [Rossellomorea aquimaris]